jgi:hypothetical protein
MPKAPPKLNDGKPRLGLVSPLFTEPVARVLEFGARKYKLWSWVDGYKYSEIYDATQRHLTAWWMGETLDSESGLHHLAHAACNLMFLLHWNAMGRTDLDDRPTEVFKRERN